MALVYCPLSIHITDLLGRILSLAFNPIRQLKNLYDTYLFDLIVGMYVFF